MSEEKKKSCETLRKQFELLAERSQSESNNNILCMMTTSMIEIHRTLYSNAQARFDFFSKPEQQES